MQRKLAYYEFFLYLCTVKIKNKNDENRKNDIGSRHAHDEYDGAGTGPADERIYRPADGEDDGGGETGADEPAARTVVRNGRREGQSAAEARGRGKARHGAEPEGRGRYPQATGNGAEEPIEDSSTGGYGRDSRLRDGIPHPLRHVVQLGSEGH